MLGLNETIDQLTTAQSVRWYVDVLRREDGNVLRRALEFEAEGQRKRGQTGHEKSRLGAEYDGWFEQEGCTLPTKVDSWS